MGLIGRLLASLFGGGRNVIAETVEVFRENAEAAAVREADGRSAALAQYAAEFAQPRKGWFDRLVDGLNRLPRPIMAFGVLGLMVSAMVSPYWFAERMVGLGLVPEPLWWLMGAIVSFYFGARTREQGQEFQRSLAETVARVPEVARGIETLQDLAPRAAEAGTPGAADPATDAGATLSAVAPSGNPALEDWARSGG